MSKDLNATGRWLKRSRRASGRAPGSRRARRHPARGARARRARRRRAARCSKACWKWRTCRCATSWCRACQMVSVRRDDPPARILPAVVESGHSRFPVMDEDRDDIVGILLAKDLLRMYAAELEGALRHPRVHAPGRVRAGIQAAQRAAEGIPPQPQSHGASSSTNTAASRAW